MMDDGMIGMVKPTIIDKRKLFEQVAGHIEREILAGRLKPGDSLPPERDLREAFGVGRPAIREALISLQNSGLIEIGNGAPARVAKPDPQRIIAGIVPAVQQFLVDSEGQRQLQGVRLFLEVGLVRHAAVHATDDDVAQLEAALEQNRLAMGNKADSIRTDVEFHFVFAKIMDNAVFRAIYDAMATWLLAQRHAAPIKPGDYEMGYNEHRRIFLAVAARDPDAAQEAMQAHLERGWNWSGATGPSRGTKSGAPKRVRGARSPS
jgi:GntR family transcriptional repressor for pyruvate dehydrogenase complex